jgi:hypothetical protein
MKRLASRLAVVTGAVALGGCAQTGLSGWTTLLDGTKGMDNFNVVGQADWGAVDGAIQATKGAQTQSFLVTKNSYANFALRVEFWASDDANSGVFVRCQNPAQITDESCYEANIFDRRPDPTYGTGAITKVAKAPDPMPKAGGKWNTYDIVAQGKRLMVVLNGVKTVDVEDSKFAGGPIALQWGAGTIKFRRVEIRTM